MSPATVSFWQIFFSALNILGSFIQRTSINKKKTKIYMTDFLNIKLFYDYIMNILNTYRQSYTISEYLLSK